ncbi:hypothetical protein D3C72_1886030 [compost metagenome]
MDLNLDRDLQAVIHALLVEVKAGRSLLHPTLDACLFIGLALGHFVGALALHGPPLGDDPAAGIAAGDQENLKRLGLLANPETERRILHARRSTQHQLHIGCEPVQEVQGRLLSS